MHLPRVSFSVSFAAPVLVAITCLGSAGCVAHPWGRGFVTVGYGTSAYVVAQRPPVPQATVYAVGAAPYEGAQWVEAHWEWSGSAYVWMDGYWVRPSEQYAFVQPRWEARGAGYVYVEGGWSDRAGVIVVPASSARDYDERAVGVIVDAPRPTATVYVAPPARDDRDHVVVSPPPPRGVVVVATPERGPVVVGPPPGRAHDEHQHEEHGPARAPVVVTPPQGGVSVEVEAHGDGERGGRGRGRPQ